GAAHAPGRGRPTPAIGQVENNFVWAINTRLRARHEVTMSDEDLEQDELDTADEDDGEELSASDDVDGDDDADVPAPSSKKAKQAVDTEELPSVEAKQKERDALARAMEEFLARGGRVQEIEPNVVADPPKKPDSKYGSRPI